MKKRIVYKLGFAVLFTVFFWTMPAGAAEKILTHKNKKGRVNEWIYEKDGAIYKREYDRNGDGKPDLRILEDRGRLVRKEYDNHFDGKFEKIEKPLARGSSGRIKTMNSQNDRR